VGDLAEDHRRPAPDDLTPLHAGEASVTRSGLRAEIGSSDIESGASSSGGRRSSRVTATVPGFEVTPIGRVESPLTDPASAPKQGDEGAPDAWLVFEPAVLDALEGIRAGHEVIVLTWLDRARRDVLRVHPRGDVSRPEQGVFSTRSPHRPNPTGLHRVEIASIDGGRVRVRNLEAVDGTPIVDVKPVLSDDVGER